MYTDIQMQSDNPPRNCRMEAVRKVTLKNIAGILLNKNDNKANVQIHTYPRLNTF